MKKRSRKHAQRKAVRARGTPALFCRCKERCCSAKGKRCACKCHGAGHASRPPRRSKKAAPRRAVRSSSPSLTVMRFGTPQSITYRRHDGKRFRHTFGRGAQLLVPKDGSDLIIIKGVRATRFLEG